MTSDGDSRSVSSDAQLHAYGVSGLGRPRLTSRRRVPRYCGSVSGIVQDSGGGEPLFGGRIVLRSTLAELCLTESFFPDARQGAEPHVHEHHADSFYVLEGELGVLVDDTEVLVGPGALRVRAAAASCTASAARTTARFLNFHTPDGGFAENLWARDRGEPGGFDSIDAEPGEGMPPTDAVVLHAGEGERARSQSIRVAIDQDRPRRAVR